MRKKVWQRKNNRPMEEGFDGKNISAKPKLSRNVIHSRLKKPGLT